MPPMLNYSLSDALIGLFSLVVGAFFGDFLKGFAGNFWSRFGTTVRSALTPKVGTKKKDEYFNLGALETSLFLIDGNGHAQYTPQSLKAKYSDGSPESPDDISDRILRKEMQMEKEREAGNLTIWDGIGVGLQNYNILRDQHEVNLAIDLNFYKSRYAAFQAVVGAIATEDRNLQGSIYSRYLKNINPRETIPFLARHVGVVAVVATSDQKLVVVRRSSRTGMRPSQHDVSIVEGIEPTKDADLSGSWTEIDVYKTIIRGCDEELGFKPTHEQIKILGLGVDMKYYQFNFVAFIQSQVRSDEMVSKRNGRAKDAWETQVELLNFELSEVVEFIATHKMWGFAVIGLYWALLQKFTRRAVDAKANQVLTTDRIGNLQ